MKTKRKERNEMWETEEKISYDPDEFLLLTLSSSSYLLRIDSSYSSSSYFLLQRRCGGEWMDCRFLKRFPKKAKNIYISYLDKKISPFRDSTP
mmetsp:Transcript_24936/g.25377  ORF Transcript_24936/g.25377 Transcript_24936/m.25377 type:complete len:93 (-) Transcript_24936:185-463(-)